MIDRTFDLPQSGESFEIITNSRADFISSPISDCPQDYSLETSNGGQAPDEFSIDSFGQLTFRNSASGAIAADLVIVITTNGGSYLPGAHPVEQRTNVFRVSSECGYTSTTLTRPTITPLTMAANSNQG